MATVTYLTTRKTKVTSNHESGNPPTQPPKAIPYKFEILWTTPDNKYAVVDGFMPLEDAKRFVR